jgi:hypothetical protein
MSHWPRLLFIALLAPGAAHAERVHVLAARSERAIADTESAELRSALTTAVRAHGAEPVGSVTAPCDDGACIAQRIRETGADCALELVVWRGSEGETTGISVSLVLSGGDRYGEGTQLARGESVAAAIERATAGAFARMRRGPGPWLEIAGQPAGATIAVDGRVVGTLPQTVRVTGGLHRILVSHPGYVPSDLTVTVPRNIDGFKRLPVEMRVQETNAANTESPATDSPSVLNYVIAGSAAAVAVVMAIGPIRTAAHDGECGRIEDGVCTGVVHFGVPQALQLTAAGVILGAGTAFAVWSPLRTSDDLTFGVAFSRNF